MPFVQRCTCRLWSRRSILSQDDILACALKLNFQGIFTIRNPDIFKLQAIQAQTIPPLAFEHQTSASAHPEINFRDPETAFASKSSGSLLKSLCTLQACRIKPLVNNAASLLKISRACLGNKVTDSIVEKTFFNHFCAGKRLTKPSISSATL